MPWYSMGSMRTHRSDRARWPGEMDGDNGVQMALDMVQCVQTPIEFIVKRKRGEVWGRG